MASVEIRIFVGVSVWCEKFNTYDKNSNNVLCVRITLCMKIHSGKDWRRTLYILRMFTRDLPFEEIVMNAKCECEWIINNMNLISVPRSKFARTTYFNNYNLMKFETRNWSFVFRLSATRKKSRIYKSPTHTRSELYNTIRSQRKNSAFSVFSKYLRRVRRTALIPPFLRVGCEDTWDLIEDWNNFSQYILWHVDP